jgi:hypothetical protein
LKKKNKPIKIEITLETEADKKRFARNERKIAKLLGLGSSSDVDKSLLLD